MKPRPKYVVDPQDPRAPPSDVWAQMTPEERAEVVAALPSAFPLGWPVPAEELPRAPSSEVWAAMSETERRKVVESLPSAVGFGPPEGDEHRIAVERARDPLQAFFERLGRRVYISSNLPVYYPGESMFSPDLLAVLDVDPRPRRSWTVDDEKRGLDFVLEVVVRGHKTKDTKRNVDLYARLGITEYFVFDPPKLIVRAHALTPGTRTYAPLLGQHGRFPSHVLGLELGVEDGVLRFFSNGALVPETRDLLHRAQRLVDEVMAKHEAEAARADAEAARADEEARRADEEARRADEAEARLRDALAEIERLNRR